MRSLIQGGVSRQLAIIGVASLIAGHVARGQGTGTRMGTLRGVVVDSATRAPISGVDVAVPELHQAARTDDQGRFTLLELPAGEIELTARRVGYEPQRETIIATGGPRDSVLIVLVSQPVVLAGVAVSGAEQRQRQGVQGFYARRSKGLGAFVTREDLEARHARVPTDALNMPGVSVVHTRYGNSVRFTTRATMRRDCQPTLWIDGQRASGMELDEIPVNDIEGIELYHGPSVTPAQFWQGNTSGAACGTIVVWSRTPGM